MEAKDLEIDCLPKEAIGGMQVGIPYTAVRIRHIPTGLIAICDSYRSQHRNRNVALSMIEYGLAEVNYGTV